MAEDAGGQGVQLRRDRAVLAVGGQAEEGPGDVVAAAAGGAEHLVDAARQHLARAVQPDLRVIGGAQLGLRQRAGFGIDQQEAGLGAAAVHAEETGRRDRARHHASSGYRRTPCTTRLTTPCGLGLSGDRPSAREAKKAYICAAATNGNSRSMSAAVSMPGIARLSSRCAARGWAVISSTCPAQPSARSSSTKSRS